MGKVLSTNEYLRLISDQKEATAKFNEMQQAVEKKKNYTYGNYLRFFPEMIRIDGKDHQGNTEHPRANRYK